MNVQGKLLWSSLCVTVSYGLIGCAHQQAAVAPTEAAAPAPVAKAAPPPAEVVETPATRAEDDLAALLKGSALHFGFNEAVLTPESRDRLQKLSEALRTRPKVSVKISGNCDERGTEEYNLALGQKRAAVAKKYLVGLGVDEGRIVTVSYGDERPVDPRHTDDAWSANRRDDVEPNR